METQKTEQKPFQQQTEITLYAVALNSYEHGLHQKGLTLVKLNNIRAARLFLPTKEILETHWAKEYVRVRKEEILNEKRKPEQKVFTRVEPLCIGVKSVHFDAILAELRSKCRDFGPDEQAIGCVVSGYKPVCLLCRVEDEDKPTTK